MDSLGRAQGIFIDKQAIAMQVEHLDRLSDDELLSKLSESLTVLAESGMPLPLALPGVPQDDPPD